MDVSAVPRPHDGGYVRPTDAGMVCLSCHRHPFWFDDVCQVAPRLYWALRDYHGFDHGDAMRLAMGE